MEEGEKQFEEKNSFPVTLPPLPPLPLRRRSARPYLRMPVPFLLPVPPQSHPVTQHRSLPYNARLPHNNPKRVTQQNSRSKGRSGMQVRSEDLRRPRLES